MGLSRQEPPPPAKSTLKADLESFPSLPACSTCLASEALVGNAGGGACSRGQAWGELC